MMIAVTDKDYYRYEVHSLIKAFFPKEDVKILLPDYDKRKYPQVPFLTVAYTPDAVLIRDASGNILGQMRAPEGEDFSKKGKCLKDSLKHLLYSILSDRTGKSLPWGELIGIRPTKIAMGRLLMGESVQEAAAFMEREHRVSDEKALLAAQIADRERQILSGIHYEDGYSLYVGIPFCPTTCLYCSFTSFNLGTWKDRVDEYLDALVREIEAAAPLMRDKVLDTVYLGGGTPTTLEPRQMDRLICAIEENFDPQGVQEFTCEAGRPDSITEEKLNVLKRHGVTRMSVNPQTMSDETLRRIGRHHTVQQTIDAFHMARRAGFDNINMDIILGLPEEDERDVQHTMDVIGSLGPDDLTVHSLAIKRGSRLQAFIEKNGYSSMNNIDRCIDIAAEGAAEMGLVPYYLYRQKQMSGNFENVGYARPGKAGIYNILIMEEKQTILALGAGSITKAVFPDGRIERSDNCKDVDTYIRNIDEMIGRKKRLLGR